MQLQRRSSSQANQLLGDISRAWHDVAGQVVLSFVAELSVAVITPQVVWAPLMQSRHLAVHCCLCLLHSPSCPEAHVGSRQLPAVPLCAQGPWQWAQG